MTHRISQTAYKAKEAMLAAVQIFNNPLITFKAESYIVLSIIAWTYLLQCFLKERGVDYRYTENRKGKKRFVKNPDGSYRFWELDKLLDHSSCPLDKATVSNLRFLIGLRNHIEHHRPSGLDNYLSARYQACAMNFNQYMNLLISPKMGLDKHLGLSIQFLRMSYSQIKSINPSRIKISADIKAYIDNFDRALPKDVFRDQHFAYRLAFSPVVVNKPGQADEVVEFVDPNSPLGKTLSKQYWIKKEVEKPKFRATEVVNIIQTSGFPDFKRSEHTLFWQKYKAKDPVKGYGVMVVNYWYWYQSWVDFLLSTLSKERLK